MSLTKQAPEPSVPLGDSPTEPHAAAWDSVDELGLQSFPASDPPPYL